MINRKRDFGTTGGALFGFIGFMFIQYIIISQEGFEFSAQGARTLIFMNTGVLLFILFAYNTVMAGGLINEEITSGRIKIWLSLPVLRGHVFSRMIKRFLKRSFILSLLLFMFIMVLVNSICNTTPENLFIAVTGVIQIILVNVAFATLMAVAIKRSARMPFTIILPIAIFWLQQLFYINMSPDATAVDKAANIILTVLLPIHVAYQNIVYGMSPYTDVSVLYSAESPLQGNIILVIWLVMVSVFVMRLVKNYETA